MFVGNGLRRHRDEREGGASAMKRCGDMICDYYTSCPSVTGIEYAQHRVSEHSSLMRWRYDGAVGGNLRSVGFHGGGSTTSEKLSQLHTSYLQLNYRPTAHGSNAMRQFIPSLSVFGCDENSVTLHDAHPDKPPATAFTAPLAKQVKIKILVKVACTLTLFADIIPHECMCYQSKWTDHVLVGFFFASCDNNSDPWP